MKNNNHKVVLSETGPINQRRFLEAAILAFSPRVAVMTVMNTVTNNRYRPQSIQGLELQEERSFFLDDNFSIAFAKDLYVFKNTRKHIINLIKTDKLYYSDYGIISESLLANGFKGLASVCLAHINSDTYVAFIELNGIYYLLRVENGYLSSFQRRDDMRTEAPFQTVTSDDIEFECSPDGFMLFEAYYNHLPMTAFLKPVTEE